WGALAMAVIVGIAALAARPLADQLGAKYSSRPYFEVAVGWGLLVAVGVAAGCSRRLAVHRGPVLCAVVAVDVLALFMAPELSAPRSVQVDTAPAAYLSRHLGEQRFF